MNDFKFSIIIPTYNSELGLKETINSIISQTLNFKDNIEIVIVDRDSEDRTEEICRQYQQDYPDNVKFIQLDSTSLEK
jgi:glycosyltransferase involved in cell wall biosynthesis